ncbi:MAG TPA: PTS fructose transporter subunit IIA [Thermoanaerobaculia bacterium]|nr:PTS fructose transporter subunit IIA [Thermoanaerobaculia bacterium]
MFRTLVVTQGALASELVAAGKRIAGTLSQCQAVSLGWDDDLATARERIASAMAEAGPSEVLLLVDLFGSTPCQAALALAEPGRVEVVTGANLPMVVRLGCPGGESLSVSEAAEWLTAKGQGSIQHAQPRGAGSAPAPCAEPVEVG